MRHGYTDEDDHFFKKKKAFHSCMCIISFALNHNIVFISGLIERRSYTKKIKQKISRISILLKKRNSLAKTVIYCPNYARTNNTYVLGLVAWQGSKRTF
jgi:hypothetical protein